MSTTYAYRKLPINADEGFPQAFLLVLGEATYRFTLYVNVAEEALPADLGSVLDLATGRAFLALAVARQDAGGETVLLRRRVVPGLEYRAGDLMVTFRTVRVAVRNLNGVGAFGSQIVGGVALR